VIDTADWEAVNLEAFGNATVGVANVLGDDGSLAYCRMVGWLTLDEYVVGFEVPKTAGTFQLIWPGNPSIDITPTE
jgi:hypothetical protein